MRRPPQKDNGHGGDVARPWMQEPAADYYPQQPSSMREQAEEVLNLLMRRKWIVLVICVLVVAGGAYHTFNQTPTYETSGLVMISDRGQGQAGPQRDGEEERDLFARSNRSVENELLILRNSNTLRRAVADRLLEADVLPGTDRPIPVTRDADGNTRSADAIAPRLGGMVSFSSAGRDARVIQMRGRSNEPREAALVANLFMEEYVNLTRRSSRANMVASREFLEEQVEERYAELDDVETRIQEYMRQEGAVALDGEGQRLISRIADAEANLDAAQIQKSQREASIASMQEELESISPRLAERIASGVEREIQALQDNITQAEQARQELNERENLSPNEERRLQQISDRIERFRAEARELSESYVDEVLGVGGVGLSAGQGLTHVTQLQRNIIDERIALSGLEAEINLYEQRLNRYEGELETLPAQARQLANLEREQAYLEGVYRNLVEQLQDVRMREQTELGYADRVNEAFVPGRPSSPDVQRNLMLAVLMGLLLGVGGAFLRDRMDSRLYKPEQVRTSGYRLLTTVPDLTPFRKEQFNGVDAVEYKNHRVSTALVTALTSSAAPAEAYRHLRTNLQFARPEEVLDVVMVSSPGMGDGKSSTAANLAIAMAQAGNRTLLLDADLRRPQVHSLFGMERGPGLSSHLRNGADSTLALQRTVVPHLYALPAGEPVGNPSELLGSPAFRNVLAALREHFDYIVIDTPPVLAATDATLLSTQCDGTIMVTRAGVTTEPELEEALATLEDVGTTVDGIVFNAFKVSMAFGYKLRYRHYATYGHYGQYTPDVPTEEIDDDPQVLRV